MTERSTSEPSLSAPPFIRVAQIYGTAQLGLVKASLSHAAVHYLIHDEHTVQIASDRALALGGAALFVAQDQVEETLDLLHESEPEGFQGPSLAFIFVWFIILFTGYVAVPQVHLTGMSIVRREEQSEAVLLS